jgi:hypothetical protein
LEFSFNGRRCISNSTVFAIYCSCEFGGFALLGALQSYAFCRCWSRSRTIGIRKFIPANLEYSYCCFICNSVATRAWGTQGDFSAPHEGLGLEIGRDYLHRSCNCGRFLVGVCVENLPVYLSERCVMRLPVGFCELTKRKTKCNANYL